MKRKIFPPHSQECFDDGEDAERLGYGVRHGGLHQRSEGTVQHQPGHCPRDESVHLCHQGGTDSGAKTVAIEIDGWIERGVRAVVDPVEGGSGIQVSAVFRGLPNREG